MRSLPVVALLVVVPLAGCVGPLGATDGLPDEDPVDVDVSKDWPTHVLDNEKDHNHTLYEHHQNKSTPNFEEVGWNPQITDYHGQTSGGYHCGDTARTDNRTLAVSHSLRTDIAFVVTDVTDPENPEKIGELVLPNVQTYDVALTPDGDQVAVATTDSGSGEDDIAPAAVESETVTPVWRDACTGTSQALPSDVPYRSGVLLVDIADPSAPAVADYRPLPALGAHSVFAGDAGGETFVLASTTNLAHQGSYFSFFTVDETPMGPKLAPYGVWQSQYPTAETPSAINGHVDGWIQDHPKTGQTLGYLANWNGGVVIVELAGRGQIEPVARWDRHELDPDHPPDLEFNNRMGQIHEAHPMPEMWGDTHYTFIGQEVGEPPEGRPTGQVIMLDTTDPSNPEAVARWTLPADVEWGPDVDGEQFLLYSTHYVEVIDRTLFVSMYHGGVWAVDVEPPVPTELETLGAYLPADESPEPPGDLPARIAFTPTVLETRPLDDDEGTLAVWDAVGGIHTVRFDRTMDVPTPDPWTEDSWIER